MSNYLLIQLSYSIIPLFHYPITPSLQYSISPTPYPTPDSLYIIHLDSIRKNLSRLLQLLVVLSNILLYYCDELEVQNERTRDWTRFQLF
jgi:hypothetical protein